ncbi:TPA: DUF551 domain-containing protein [Kluyvera georgiana]|nr:DUF551 domain-containing protein [Kluyvera georgiana]
MSEISKTERVPDEELDQMIWKLERDGMTPKMLSLMRELREVRRAKGEPVAYIFKHPAGKLFWALTDESNKAQSDVIPVYATPPSVVIPPQIEPDYEVIKGILPTANPDEYACCIAADMWNACRAAMLNAEKLNQPVSETERTHPNSFTDAELEMMAHGDNPQANAYRELLAFRRNSQDGWIPVSERMPEGMTDVNISNGFGVGQAWWDGDGWQTQHDYYAVPGEVTHWQPLPEPPKEVKSEQ